MTDNLVDRLFSLRGRVAIVAGASRGIGQGIAQGLVGAGAAVIGCGRSATPEGSVTYEYRRCDISDRDAFGRLCMDVHQRHGRVDIYVHAAGITGPATQPSDKLDGFRETIEMNLTAAYRCCSDVLPYMVMTGSGSIINVTSIGSVLGFPQNPGYVASKGGLRMLTKALALDLAEKNIRVNNLAPGYIRTGMTEKSYSDPGSNEERLRRMIIPRWGQPDDLVGAAIFLAADASSYVTGQDLFVDGGWTAKGL